MATKPIKTHKPKVSETGKVTLEEKPPKRSKSQQIAAKRKPKQRVVRRSV